MKVTRIAYSRGLNAGKYQRLEEQARRLGSVRTLVWRQYGSLKGVGTTDRVIRDRWMKDGTARGFRVPANAWKETVRDVFADIRANREAAKVPVRRAVSRRFADEEPRKRRCAALRHDRWTADSYLSRMMRRHWRRGGSAVRNQIVVRSDQYRTYTLVEGGNVWLSVPSLVRRRTIAVPLNTTVAPTGTLRLILRDGRVEAHYVIDGRELKSSRRPCGSKRIGVDKGYSEVLTDSDGRHHGEALGELLRTESDFLKAKNTRRAKIRAVAERAREEGDAAKADRITRNNLGTVKRGRRRRRFAALARSVTFTAVHAVVDRAGHVVAEDLTRSLPARKRLGKDANRRLAAWTKGVTAEALASVSERRGSALTLVNAAYTSQVAPCCRVLGRRTGDRLHCTRCGAVWQADHAAAINVLERHGDPDISLLTPHTRVKRIIQERADRRRTRLPVQDSSTTVRRANHPNRTALTRNRKQEWAR
ncbi:zinc ribbon domain-containing protein [Streptomyces sp. NPDC002057]|uniref:zinc ribbon domain-containing protein n=1 Tax=Streptomyces sp. NPDC002057 TaxID=3154664 RepID=UPI003331803C